YRISPWTTCQINDRLCLHFSRFTEYTSNSEFDGARRARSFGHSHESTLSHSLGDKTQTLRFFERGSGFGQALVRNVWIGNDLLGVTLKERRQIFVATAYTNQASHWHQGKNRNERPGHSG